MTEEEKKEIEELRAQKEQMEAALKEKKYSQAELDAAVLNVWLQQQPILMQKLRVFKNQA
ncbi:hypothetical protein GQR36_25205 [Enterococcus termitis]